MTDNKLAMSLDDIIKMNKANAKTQKGGAGGSSGSKGGKGGQQQKKAVGGGVRGRGKVQMKRKAGGQQAKGNNKQATNNANKANGNGGGQQKAGATKGFKRQGGPIRRKAVGGGQAARRGSGAGAGNKPSTSKQQPTAATKKLVQKLVKKALAQNTRRPVTVVARRPIRGGRVAVVRRGAARLAAIPARPTLSKLNPRSRVIGRQRAIVGGASTSRVIRGRGASRFQRQAVAVREEYLVPVATTSAQRRRVVPAARPVIVERYATARPAIEERVVYARAPQPRREQVVYVERRQAGGNGGRRQGGGYRPSYAQQQPRYQYVRRPAQQQQRRVESRNPFDVPSNPLLRDSGAGGGNGGGRGRRFQY